MSESAPEERPESQTEANVRRSLQFLMGVSQELSQWSGHLDWSRRLAAEGFLQSSALKEAFSKVSRVDFFPDDQKADEGYDRPFEIGYGQTISQPSLVAGMLEHLQLEPGQNILDVGSGSGWTTALMAHVTGSEGTVTGVEKVEELVAVGTANVSKYEFPWVTIKQAGSELGYPNNAPYDRILVSAHMLEEWVPELSTQLSEDNGALLAPVASPGNHGSKGTFDQSLMLFTKQGGQVTSEVITEGVGFVPLIHEPDSANAA